jgi:nucleoside-diphosphate-sugar epimerase
VAGIRVALGRPSRLFPVSASALEAAAAIVGLRGRMRRLTGSLEVDPSALMATLGWSPRVALADGLADTVETWREARAP